MSNIISNHDFSLDLQSWNTRSCHAYVFIPQSGSIKGLQPLSGHGYAVATQRSEHCQGIEQDITAKVSAGKKFNVLANVGVQGGYCCFSVVRATLQLEYCDAEAEYQIFGSVAASGVKWERLQASFCLERMPKRVVFYLEGPGCGVDLLVDSVIISCEIVEEETERERNLIEGLLEVTEKLKKEYKKLKMKMKKQMFLMEEVERERNVIKGLLEEKEKLEKKNEELKMKKDELKLTWKEESEREMNVIKGLLEEKGKLEKDNAELKTIIKEDEFKLMLKEEVERERNLIKGLLDEKEKLEKDNVELKTLIKEDEFILVSKKGMKRKFYFQSALIFCCSLQFILVFVELDLLKKIYS